MHLGQRSPVQLVLIGLCLQVGCAAKLAITSLAPSSVFLGPSRDIVIVGGDGRRAAREQVYSQLVERARHGGFFHVIDLSREGFSTRRDGGRLFLETFARPLGDSEVGLWIDVETGPSRVVLSVTAFDASGEPLIQAHEVEAGSEADAVTILLQQITPSETTRYVWLDEDDSGQLPILEVALGGNIARAREDMKAYLDRQPGNAVAVYNLAVLTEAMGRVREAVALYDRALVMAPKDLYSETRDEAARYAQLADTLDGHAAQPSSNQNE